MTVIRHERINDTTARELLLDEAFGEDRYRKSSQQLREGRLPAERLGFVATDGSRVIGTARLWNIACGPGRSGLLLGPVAVANDRRNEGIGGGLVTRAIEAARRLGHAAIILVGDAPYYGRFGFSAEKAGGLWMPGPFERSRLLGLELKAGALDGACGLIGGTGRLVPQPDLAALAAQDVRVKDSRTQRARRIPRAA
jgi:predicted N-acetyltransferase YhbS